MHFNDDQITILIHATRWGEVLISHAYFSRGKGSGSTNQEQIETVFFALFIF